MNSQSNAISGSEVGTRDVASTAGWRTNPFFWALRREFWEYRALYVAPLAAAGIFLFGFIVTIGHQVTKVRGMSGMDAMEQRNALAGPYDMASGLMMAVGIIVGAYYALDALYGERRDRSILFWKSLPVSDLTTVLAKTVIPIILLQLLCWMIAVVLQFLMLLIQSAVMAGSGEHVSMLWAQLSPIEMWVMLLNHLITVHGLYYAPFYGWMLLVSSWARKAPVLWAALPVLALGALEKLIFNTSHFFQMLTDRLGGNPVVVFVKDWPADPMTQLMPGHFLLSPGLWLGLIFTALCVAGAVRMRRYRSPL
jgi:ABC-2 type transport system permease protein